MPKVIAFFITLLVVLAGIFSGQNFCANSESCIKDLSGEYEEGEVLGEFMGEKVPVTEGRVQPADSSEAKVLSEVSGFEKRIEVDLTNQMLYAYEGSNLIMSFPVSTGKWHYTPTGTFRIWIKLRYTRMKGGVPGTGSYYNLPNVPYTMYFYNDEHPKHRGYGLHGAYWHNNFGYPMSHGCVNISPENAGKLYNWAEPVTQKNVTYATDESPGTIIHIYGETPRN